MAVRRILTWKNPLLMTRDRDTKHFSIAEYDFVLPKDQIAQVAVERGSSRLLLVDRQEQSFSDDAFGNLATRIPPDSVLVINNSKVFPARLFGKTNEGLDIEVFLVRSLGENMWEVMLRPAKKVRSGDKLVFARGLSGIVEKVPEQRSTICFETPFDLDTIIDEIGTTPLPPYITRPNGPDAYDRNRYQTVYAQHRGSIAAPTAGLHFTTDILKEIEDKGISVVEITLHVGYGTFEPVRAEDLRDHHVLPERYSISDGAAATLNCALESDRRIIAVGTTTTRALEDALSKAEFFRAKADIAELTIYPGYKFKAVDGLLTNFHLPESSLLVLTATFGGYDLIMGAYRHAVKSKYRFYSYGDCMLVI